MIHIIDFGESPKEAFKNGLLKGLCGPAMLFGRYDARISVPKVQPVALPARFHQANCDALAISQDFQLALLNERK